MQDLVLWILLGVALNIWIDLFVKVFKIWCSISAELEKIYHNLVSEYYKNGGV